MVCGDRITRPVAFGEENRDGAAGTLVPFSERVMFKGEVAGPGFGHFRKCRPKFYQAVLALSGVALYRGTINVRIDGEMPYFPLPDTQRIPGQDQIDLDHNQDILPTPCVMEGRLGLRTVLSGRLDSEDLARTTGSLH